MLVQHVTEGLEPELEPVGLRLVAAEEDDRAAAGSHYRGEPLDVDRVREDLPRAARLAEEEVGGALAERALVDDVVGGEHRAPERHVELVGLAPAQPG